MASALGVVAFVLLTSRCDALVLPPPPPPPSSTRCQDMHLPTRRGIEHEVICSFGGIQKYTASVLPGTYFNLFCKTLDIPNDVQAHLGLAGSLSKYFLLDQCPLPTSSYVDTMKNLGVTSVKQLKIRKTKDTSLRRKDLEGLDELNVENLNLYDNNLKHIAEDAFKAVPNLTKLELSFNEGLRLSAGIFRPLKHLRVLRLSEMGLQELPENMFLPPTLEALYLGRNNLQRLTPRTFEGATNLKTLDLSSNSLTDLPLDTFKLLINLKSIDLSFNNLSTLPSGLFRYNKKLKRLSITQMDGTVPKELLSDMRKKIFEKGSCDFVESKPGTFVQQCRDE